MYPGDVSGFAFAWNGKVFLVLSKDHVIKM